jgi:enoyl-CoA hydratase
MYTCFNVEIADNIAHIQMKRPEKSNSMIREFWNELPEIVADIDDNAKARVIVLSGQGKHFCSGMDLSVLDGGGIVGGGGERKVEMGRARAGFYKHVLHLQNAFSCLDFARIPVIAAVQGACMGGGVDMTSACDMRYATKDAFFSIHEINIGMTADVGTFPRLCNLIPQGMVRELAYTGRRLYADEAKEIGLVNKVYETHEEMLAGVMDVAREIASKSPLAVHGSKEMINYARDHTIKDGLDYIAVWQTGMLQSADMTEAFTAKGEKRDPDYDDLLPLRKGM